MAINCIKIRIEQQEVDQVTGGLLDFCLFDLLSAVLNYSSNKVTAY